MDDKVFFIDEYFKQREEDINRAADLLSNQSYHLEGILVVSCYIGAFARLRYPALQDHDSYTKILLEYSGARSFFEQVDILFFYEWPNSVLKNRKEYKKLKQHAEIAQFFNSRFDLSNTLDVTTRYISQDEFISKVRSAKISGFDEQNLGVNLRLFSLAYVCYHYIRCYAVHNALFPLINKSTTPDGKIVYRSNHVLTGQKLLETVRNIHWNLWNECHSKGKCPEQLD